MAFLRSSMGHSSGRPISPLCTRPWWNSPTLCTSVILILNNTSKKWFISAADSLWNYWYIFSTNVEKDCVSHSKTLRERGKYIHKAQDKEVNASERASSGYTSAKWRVPLRGVRSYLAASSRIQISWTSPWPPGLRLTVSNALAAGSSVDWGSLTVT